MSKPIKHPPAYFEGAVNNLEEHCNDLDVRRRFLTNNVNTLERSIPAIMAIYLLMSADNFEDPPLCKIRQIVKELTPHPDPTERLLEDLKRETHSLEEETKDLHEKIINADIELEETGMQLDNLTHSNEELLKTVTKLEKEIASNTVPSLHSINSEDLCYLNKIRQLGEHELDLKCRTKELEEKEAILNEQMYKLLESKGYESTCHQDSKCECHAHCLKKKNDIPKPCICLNAGKPGVKCEKNSCVPGCRRNAVHGRLGQCQARICCASTNSRCMKAISFTDFKTPCALPSHFAGCKRPVKVNSFDCHKRIKMKCMKCHEQTKTCKCESADLPISPQSETDSTNLNHNEEQSSKSASKSASMENEPINEPKSEQLSIKNEETSKPPSIKHESISEPKLEQLSTDNGGTFEKAYIKEESITEPKSEPDPTDGTDVSISEKIDIFDDPQKPDSDSKFREANEEPLQKEVDTDQIDDSEGFFTSEE